MHLRFFHVIFSFLLCLDTDAEILPQNRKRDVREEVLEERGSYMKKGTEVFLTLCSMFRHTQAAEHIPVGLGLGAPAWIWNTNGPGPGTTMMERGGEEEEGGGGGGGEVRGMCLYSDLLPDCVKRGHLGLSMTKFILKQLNLESFYFLFFPNRQHFLFACTKPSFSFCVQ